MAGSRPGTTSLCDYHDPARMGWGALRVWNDDEIAPGTGFPPHPHADMEIITYVREGAITHQDSLGNEGRTAAGDVQVMSAGSGIRHGEYNLEAGPTRLFQIWIIPTARRGAPFWGARPFPGPIGAGRFVTLASGDAAEADALPIRADGRVLAATLAAGQRTSVACGPGATLISSPPPVRSRSTGYSIGARDGAAIADETNLDIAALEEAEIVLVETA